MRHHGFRPRKGGIFRPKPQHRRSHHSSRAQTEAAGGPARARAKAEKEASQPPLASPYDIIGRYGPTPRHTHRTRLLLLLMLLLPLFIQRRHHRPPPRVLRPRRAAASPISPSPARFAAFIREAPWRGALGTWCRAPPLLPASPPLSLIYQTIQPRGFACSARPPSPDQTFSPPPRATRPALSPDRLSGEWRQRQRPRWVLCVSCHRSC